MKKNFLKIITVVLSLVMLVSLLPVGAFGYSTGVIVKEDLYDTLKDITQDTLNKFGDINNDGKITVADVVLILKRIAYEERTDSFLDEDHDINIDGQITVLDAIKLLHVCANSDNVFKVDVKLSVGQEYKTYWMYKKGNLSWSCEAAPSDSVYEVTPTDGVQEVTPTDGICVEKELDKAIPPDYPPAYEDIMYRYILTPKSAGTYIFDFKFKNSETNIVEKEVIYTLTVTK